MIAETPLFKSNYNQMKIVVILLIVYQVACKTPPIFNYSYQVSFTETLEKQKRMQSTTGQLFYDPIKNRERVDWENG